LKILLSAKLQISQTVFRPLYFYVKVLVIILRVNVYFKSKKAYNFIVLSDLSIFFKIFAK